MTSVNINTANISNVKNDEQKHFPSLSMITSSLTLHHEHWEKRILISSFRGGTQLFFLNEHLTSCSLWMRLKNWIRTGYWALPGPDYQWPWAGPTWSHWSTPCCVVRCCSLASTTSPSSLCACLCTPGVNIIHLGIFKYLILIKLVYIHLYFYLLVLSPN